MPVYLNELDLGKRNLRKSSRIMFICLFLIGLFLFARHRPIYKLLWLSGSIFLVVGAVSPSLFRPIYLAWMGLAFCLGWINTRLILSVLFYFVITPIALTARIFRKRFLDLGWQEDRQSYWLERNPQPEAKDSYERIF